MIPNAPLAVAVQDHTLTMNGAQSQLDIVHYRFSF
jgi:hypothetical protein